ncbi:alpha/beta hydrolase [Antrihabitans cavernicola]|uniref:Alpha/beta hydrolase n=1 Tax=Antrihabitans cavernicola TaxID=2495913 RepID=A0A5A7S8N4_9NOCA|nr:alpha/beta hydrolase [Spelaeibacter cavernicola]KAA0022518.1 alpha/beta hydrolase [Spelaeibacter cavernicola]
MPFFDGASGQVHYRRWPGENPQVGLIFLHGRGQHSGHYHRFARALLVRGIESWALDHIGHGLSEGELDNVSQIDQLGAHALQLADIAEADRPGLPFAVMGHSLGAVTTLAAVHKQPTRFGAVVLCGTPKSVRTRSLDVPAAPALVVHGVDDRLAPVDVVREWVAGHQGVDLREFADMGHNLLHEPGYATVTDVIADFLLDTMGNR